MLAIDSVKSWTQVFEVPEHEIINCPEDPGDEEDNNHETKLRYISHSKLHNIAARLRFVSYNDMINSALENINVQTRSIINHQKGSIGSFQPKHLQVKYKISLNPKYNYNATIMLEFE